MLILGNKKLARRPSEGPYYLVQLKDKWVIEPFPSSEYDHVGHLDVWRDYIVPQLIESYNLHLTKEELEELLSAYCGMPRGRVNGSGTDATFEIPGEKAGFWYVDHGNDVPSGLSKEKAEGLVIQSFGLYALAARGMVEFRVSAHEKMNQEDIEIVQRLLKKKNKSLTKQ
jgi:hypothetical protein